MLIYILCYILISVAIFVALILQYFEYYENEESYIEIGCGDEFAIPIITLISVFWPLSFICSILIVIIHFIKYVFNLCSK